jgi:osmoprotectant transport system permease protein
MNWYDDIPEQLRLLPERLSGHVFLSLASLAIGLLISIPLGIQASRRPRLEQVILALASIIQTVPSLALLALMVFAFGTIGWVPALIALVLYSVLPLLRNTITGLQEIDPAYIKAARGIGMDPWQQLIQVEIPLALPTIVAGIRTATVWVVGAATIAQPVGATSLGNYIFVGLQTMNMASLFCGVVFAAALALTLDAALMGLESAARRRSVPRAVLSGSAILAVILAPMILGVILREPTPTGASSVAAAATEKNVSLVVGGKSFTEQYILSDLLRDQLVATGYEVTLKDGLGSATVFGALSRGEIDCYVDYSGTLWTNVMKRKDAPSQYAMNIDIATHLKQKYGIVCLGTMGFSNDYALAMRRKQAEELGVTSLSDLAAKAETLRLGTDIEFLGRPEWAAVRDAYQLKFAKMQSMEPNLMYGAIQSDQVDVITAFNTDGRIPAYDLIVLDDPRKALPPYDALILVSPKLARQGHAMKALARLVNQVDNDAMRRGNSVVDVDKGTIGEASQFVQDAIGTLND